MSFFIWLFFVFLISLPFLIVGFSIKNVGLVDTYNNLQKTKGNLDTYIRVLNICKHVAECCKNVLIDLKYIGNHTQDLKNKMIENVANRTLIEKKNVDLTEEEDYICRVFKEERLTRLSEDLVKIANKCKEVSEYSLKKNKEQIADIISKFEGKSDNEIINWFVPKIDIEYCNDLTLVKNYLDRA